MKYNESALDILFEGVHEKLDSILAQTTKTNGRVRKLEMWRVFLLGAWAVITFLMPFSWYFISHSIQNFQDDIDNRITTAIENNNDKLFEQW